MIEKTLCLLKYFFNYLRHWFDGDNGIDLTTFNTIRHSDSHSVLDARVCALDTEGSLVSWTSTTLIPPGRRELIPVNNTTSRDVRDGKFNPTLFA